MRGKYYYNLGAMLVNSGQAEAAGEAFKNAIELTPTYADAYYQYGVTLVGQAKIDPATGKVIAGPGHGRGVPEVPRTAAERTVGAVVERNADVARRQRRDQVHRSERAGQQEEEEVVS